MSIASLMNLSTGVGCLCFFFTHSVQFQFHLKCTSTGQSFLLVCVGSPAGDARGFYSVVINFFCLFFTHFRTNFLETDPLSQHTILWFTDLTLLLGYVASPNRPRNDLECVGWDVKPYSLTHDSESKHGYLSPSHSCNCGFTFSFSSGREGVDVRWVQTLSCVETAIRVHCKRL